MAQNFPPLPDTTLITDSRGPILDRDEAALSQSSGTAFPTGATLIIGMPCYRTDENKLYTLKSTGPDVWALVSDPGSFASINGGPLAGLGNRIINGNFDIWVRGTSFTEDGFKADRWSGVKQAGDAATWSRQAFALGQTDVPGEPEFFLRVDKTTSVGTAQMINQRIEGVRTFAGQEMTISYYAKVNATLAGAVSVTVTQHFGTGGASPSADVSQNVPNQPILTTSWTKFTHTLTPASIASKIMGSNGEDRLEIVWTLPDETFIVDIARVQVEIGANASPFEDRPLGLELALAQRYYLELGKSGSAWAVATTDAVTSVLFPVEMRVAPTVAYVDDTPIFNDFNIGVTPTGSILSILAATPKGVQLRMDGFTGLTIDRPAFWNQTNPIWSFDAEL